MRIFTKISISQKLYLIPLIGSAGFLMYLIMTIITALDNVKRLENAESVQFPALQTTSRALVNLEKVKELLSNAAVTGDEDALENAKTVATDTQVLFADIKRLAPSLSHETDEIEHSFNEYFQLAYKISSSMVDNTADFSLLGALSAQMNQGYNTATNQLEVFHEARLTHFKKGIADSNNSVRSMITYGAIMGAVTIILLFATAIPIVRGIKNNINQIVNSLRDIAQENGDLTLRIETKSNDEIGELVYWFNQFMEKLQGVVKDIVDSTIPLSKLAQGLNQLTDDTNQTISSQQTASTQAKNAVYNLMQNVSEVAASASEAAHSAMAASEAGSEGQRVVSQTVKQIQDLAQSVDESAIAIHKLESNIHQVSAILNVIKEVSEQTNLLALNAAIEAARAGEQGRGFAVVADEVRTLASRTKKSTEEIKVNIEQLQQAAQSAVQIMNLGKEKAEQSVISSNEAGQSLTVITDTIDTITQMNDLIAQSTSEQQIATESINLNIEDIHARSEQATISSNGLAQTSSELAGLARHLESITQQFKV